MTSGRRFIRLAAGSPFFNTLPLANHGLEWVHGDAPLAHPLDDGTAVVLERDLAAAEKELGADGKTWRNLMEPFAVHWDQFAEGCARAGASCSAVIPFLMARFGLAAVQSAKTLAAGHFGGVRARALFAGLAAHSVTRLRSPLQLERRQCCSAPLPTRWMANSEGRRRGHSTRPDWHSFSPSAELVHTSHRVDAQSFRELGGETTLTLCDTAPRALLALAGDRLAPGYRQHNSVH